MSGNSKNFPIMLGLLSIFAALFSGLAATTANPIIIVLIISAFGGIFLLMQPKWTMWIVLTIGLLATGTLPLWIPSLNKLGWGVSMLGLLLFAGATFEQITRYQSKLKTPLFIKIALIFFVYSIVISVIQWYSPGELFTAIKRYYQVWGLMFALTWLAFSLSEIQRIQRLMLWLAFAQLPFALYELFKFVPMRKALALSIPGLVPIDIVAGTFGGEMLGGGENGSMATFLIIMFAFLLSRWRSQLLTTKQFIWCSIPTLLPLFLGETKIVVIFFPVMFFGIYGKALLRNPMQGLITTIIVILITVTAGYMYAEIYINKPFLTVIQDTLSYNFGSRGYGNDYLNRTTAISFWWAQHITDPAHLIFGHGLGSAHSSAGALKPGHIAQLFTGYGIDLTAASELLWETGLMGLSLYLSIFLSAWLTASKLLKKSTSIEQSADITAIKSTLPIILIFIFYRNSPLETLTFQIIFVMQLGYLAYLARKITYDSQISSIAAQKTKNPNQNG
ncbi:MAG: hypothetical protein WC426_09905 [Sulfuriferula sp.]